MTLEDITALAKAGFSAQQITKLAQLDQQRQDPAAEPAPAPAADPTPAPAEQPKTFDDIYKAIAGMQQEIHNSNIINSAQPQAPMSADDVIASIINPPTIKEAK